MMDYAVNQRWISHRTESIIRIGYEPNVLLSIRLVNMKPETSMTNSESSSGLTRTTSAHSWAHEGSDGNEKSCRKTALALDFFLVKINNAQRLGFSSEWPSFDGLTFEFPSVRCKDSEDSAENFSRFPNWWSFATNIFRWKTPFEYFWRSRMDFRVCRKRTKMPGESEKKSVERWKREHAFYVTPWGKWRRRKIKSYRMPEEKKRFQLNKCFLYVCVCVWRYGHYGELPRALPVILLQTLSRKVI